MSGDEEDSRVIHWNAALEQVISDLGEKAQCLSWLHSDAQSVCSTRNNYINLPVITLSTLSGTASIGSDLFKGFSYASVVIGMVSIFVAILQTLNTYFSYSKLSKGHRLSSLHYQKLYSFIVIELALPRAERMQPGLLLKVVREQSERLFETSPMLPKRSILAFKTKFGENKDVSVPSVVNGLDPIEVYEEPPSFFPRLGLKVDKGAPSPVAVRVEDERVREV